MGSSEQKYQGRHVRIIGQLRSQGGERHVLILKIFSMSSEDELHCHNLEVKYAKAKILQLQQKQVRYSNFRHAFVSEFDHLVVPRGIAKNAGFDSQLFPDVFCSLMASLSSLYWLLTLTIM